MEKRIFVSNHIRDMEEEFRQVRKFFLNRQEAEFEQARILSALPFGGKTRPDPTGLESEMALLKTAGLDGKLIKKLEAEDEKRGNEYVKAAEAGLKKIGLPDGDDLHRQKIARLNHYNQAGMIQPAFIGTDIIASEKELLDEDKEGGKLGNPSVWFNDPVTTTRIKDTGNWENGLCLAYKIYLWRRKYLIWWYHWIPTGDPDQIRDLVSNWILVNLDLLGFYILHSRRKWYDCKEARVKLECGIELFQDFWYWGHSKTAKVIEKRVTNGHETDTISNSYLWDEQVQLKPNQPAYLKVWASLSTLAHGSGSYATLNFMNLLNSGIDPLVLVGL